MTLRYAVGIKIGNRADQMTVEAEDALIAALKVKTAHPEPRSPTCASETPGAINAIGIPAKSARIRPITPDVRLCPTLSDQG
jgi:tartrate dehydratase alpha subunit/fumarate hydratase class I-like protein